MDGRKTLGWTLLFFFCAALCLTFKSWEGSPLNHDEVTYLVMSRTMVESGNWLDLQFYGAIIHQRPPLAIWLLAASGGLFDFSLFATRLPAMTMALLSLFFVFLAVRELRPGDRYAAMLAAALLLATPLFYFNARRPMTDTTFLAGATAFAWAYLAAARTPRMWLAAGAAAGWMLMSKGVVTVLPLGAAGAHLLLTSRRREFKQRPLYLGAALALAIAAPWHLVQWARHGNAFWQEYIGFNVLKRAGQALFQETGWSFYLEDLWAASPLLALLFAVGLLHSAYRLWQYRPGASAQRPQGFDGHLFVLLWFLAAALPMSAASTRIEHYFLPALPALAAAASLALAEPVMSRPLGRAAAFAAALLLFVSGNALHLLRPDYSPDQTRFAQLIEASPTQRTLALNHYELVLFFDLDLPVDMRTTDPNFFAIVDSAPILHRVDAVTLQSPTDLLAELALKPAHVVTTSASLPLICGAENRNCGPGGRFVVTQGDYLVLVSPTQASSSIMSAVRIN